MNKRGTAWWGWWQKKYIPPPEHGEAYLGGFTTSISAKASGALASAELGGFATELTGYTGGVADGLSGFTFTHEFTGTLDGYGTAELTGFGSSITASGTLGGTAGASLGSFQFELVGYSGGQASLSSFTSEIQASGITGSVGVATLTLTASSLEAIGSIPNYGIAVLGGFKTTMPWAEAVLTGFNTQIYGSQTVVLNPATAYAINIMSAETTLYTFYDFSYIIRLGGSYYGVKPEGLYLLEGASDNGAAINTKVKTSMLDFDTALHKRVPYAYLDTEYDTTITTFVEGAEIATYPASFNGRRTHLARGPRGRQWEFEIKNVDGGPMKLGSLELLAELNSRKV